MNTHIAVLLLAFATAFFVAMLFAAGDAKRSTALRHFVWNPTVTMTPGRRARWACVQAACRPVHMSTGRV